MSTLATSTNLKAGVPVAEAATVALTEGVAFPVQEKATQAMLCFDSTASAFAYISGNESVFGGKELKIYVPSGRSYCLLDLGHYLQVSGEDKGKVVVKCSNAGVKATLITLR